MFLPAQPGGEEERALRRSPTSLTGAEGAKGIEVLSSPSIMEAGHTR